jgi:hypothetical protein
MVIVSTLKKTILSVVLPVYFKKRKQPPPNNANKENIIITIPTM